MRGERGLKILELYHDCGPGGAEQMILDLCCWLRGDGHGVTVVTCREGWLAQRLREREIETHVVAQRRRFDFHTLIEVLRFARAQRVNVFHAHELPAMMGLAPAALLGGVPVVATLHGRERIAARGRRRLICRLAGRCCRRVVAVSQTMERFLVRDVRVAASKVQTIYNGIDIQRYARDAAPQELRRTLGIAEGTRIIGTVGSLYSVKGQTYLLQALARVVAQVPDVACLIAGRGELRPALEREAAELGIGDRVKFLGYRTDVPELLSLMEIFVLPSLSEGLPLSLLEAQAAGKPVVASSVGGSPEVIEEGKTGFLVPLARPEMFANRISMLLEDRVLASTMGERGRSRVRQLFSLEAMGRGYLSVFQACLDGGGRRCTAWAG